MNVTAFSLLFLDSKFSPKLSLLFGKNKFLWNIFDFFISLCPLVPLIFEKSQNKLQNLEEFLILQSKIFS